MFSSLPSASKIYVSSSNKSKQKSSSAKKRRKRINNHVVVPNGVTEDDTLISSSKEPNAYDISSEKFEIINENKNVCFSDKTSCLSEKSEEQVGILTDYENIQDNGNTVSEANSCLLIDSSSVCENKQPVAEMMQNPLSGEETTYENISMPETHHFEKDLLQNIETEDVFVLNEKKGDANVNFKTNESIVACIETQTDLTFVGDFNENYTSVNNCFMIENSSEETSFDVLVDNNESLSMNENLSKFIENEEVQIDPADIEKWQDSFKLHEEENESKMKNEYDNVSVKSDCCMAVNIYNEHDTDALDNQDFSESADLTVFENKAYVAHSPAQSEGSGTESAIGCNKSLCPAVLGESCLSIQEKNIEIISNSVTGEVHQNLSEAKSQIASLDVSKSCSHLKGNSLKTHLKRPSLPDKIDILNHIPSFSDNLTCVSNHLCDKSTMTHEFEVSYTNDAKLTHVTEKKTEHKLTTKTKSVSVSIDDVASYFSKVLPPVAMLQARARSYVFGSIGTTGSLLGNEELVRYFPDNKVTVFVGTWNMNGHDPPKSIDDFLLPLDVSSLPDIYAIGVQESMQSRSEWDILLQTTLGPSHVLFSASSFGTLYLSIFLRRDLIWFCSEPEEAAVATRPASMVKTKGAVAVCFRFFGTSFLFLNSHLTAHEQKLKERLSDYEKICSSLDLPKLIPLKKNEKNKDITSRFDCVFWCGDLNFRVVQDRKSVLSFVEEKIQKPQPSCNILMKHDQLSNEMAKGTAFQGFKEEMINFIPSYKFDVGTSDFDSAKMRVPSYTDRILYRCKETSTATCLHYNAVSNIVSSDHKPVYAIFEVSIKPGRDNVPLAAGMFKREIYLEAIKRRSKTLDVHDQKQSTICNVM